MTRRPRRIDEDKKKKGLKKGKLKTIKSIKTKVSEDQERKKKFYEEMNKKLKGNG